MKTIFISMLMSLSTLFFIACSDVTNALSKNEQTKKPILNDFLANIDQNQTGVLSLGKVNIQSSGSASISSFRLQGNGYSNFNISSTGEISTKNDTNLDCVSYKNYDLEVTATNKYGESNKAKALIQINCGDEPLIKPYSIKVDYQTGNIGTLTYIRTAGGSNNPSDIKEIQLIDAPNGLSISPNGSIMLNNSLPLSRYDIKVRALNNTNVVGPYVYLTIFKTTYGNTFSSDTDDWPDYLDTSVNTAISIGQDSSSSVYANMNHPSDHDYIKIHVQSNNTNVSFELSPDGNYNNGNGGNYIALYDEYGSYYGTHSNTYPSITLNSGYYYINVHETSDFYTLHINSQASTSDNVGDNIADTWFLGSVNSTNNYVSYNSNIDHFGDRDYFQFQLDEDGEINIGTQNSNMNPYGRLYDSGGTLINENDNANNQDFSFSVNLTTGTYYVEVSAYNDELLGNYEIYINYNNP